MPAAERAGAGRIRQVRVGKTYYVPFVVTDYAPQPSERMRLTARVHFISPSGKVLFTAANFSEALAPDVRSPSVIVLNPVMEMDFDPDDPPGTYTMRVTITDHVHLTYAKAEEQFQLIRGTGAEGKAAKKPATASRSEAR